jgi:hypothetical protein
MAVFNPPASLEIVCGGPKIPEAKTNVSNTRVIRTASVNILNLFVRISPFWLNLLIRQYCVRGGRSCIFSLEY